MDIIFPERGHGAINFVRPDDSAIAAYQHSGIVAEYFSYCEEQRRKLWGKRARIVAGPGTLFPMRAEVLAQRINLLEDVQADWPIE